MKNDVVGIIAGYKAERKLKELCQLPGMKETLGFV